MPLFIKDVAITLRGWRRSPGAIAAAAAALALATAGVTAVFSMVAGVLLRPLPYPSPDGLVMVWQDLSARGGPERDWISPGLFVEWQRRSTSMAALAAVRPWQPTLIGGDEPERLRGAAVSHGYFDALGIAPALGRVFSEADDRPGGPPLVVISDALWTRKYGRDPGIVHRSIQVDGQTAEIVGVMPRSFRPPIVDAEIWMPARIARANAPRHIVVLRVLGRVKTGVGLDQARAEFRTIATQLAGEDPEWDRTKAALVPLHQDIVGPVKTMLLVLGGAIALVVLIACANLASLLLAKAAERAREMSLRTALGAKRRHIVAQLLTESLLLSMVATAIGTAIGWWALEVLLTIAPASAPRLTEVRIDAQVVLVVAVVSLVSAATAGLAPAFVAMRTDLVPTLRSGGREATGSGGLRSVLVVIEVATAIVLVIGAALLIRSFVAMQRVDLGFTPDGVLTAAVQPPRTAYRDAEALRQLHTAIVDGTRAIPGVEASAITSLLPLAGGEVRINFDIPGRARAGTPGEDPIAAMRHVSAGYVETMRMRLVKGRAIGANDSAPAPAVVLINETLARRYWPGVDPVGQRVGVDGKIATIVGVVGDVHHIGPAQPPGAEMYLPAAQFPSRNAVIVLRTAGDPAAIAPALRRVIHGIDATLAVASVAPMTVLSERIVAQPRFLATLVGGFAVLATVVTLFGIYSVLSFSVSRRTREIGVRMALGAARHTVLMMVLRQSLALVGLGLAAGTIAAAFVGGMIRSLLFGVAATDPTTYLAMAALVAAAALAASYAPAHRAARVDPIVALRDE